MAIIHDGNSVPISSTNPLPSSLFGSEIQVPMDVQSRYATTTQTQTAVLVAPTSTNSGLWLDSNGFDKLAVTAKSDANTNIHIAVSWSHDGVTASGYEEKVIPGAYNCYVSYLDTKARYFKVALYNTDAAPHTMSAWAYLKV